MTVASMWSLWLAGFSFARRKLLTVWAQLCARRECVGECVCVWGGRPNQIVGTASSVTKVAL